MGNDEAYSVEERKCLLAMARGAIAARLSGRRHQMPDGLPDRLSEIRSCFVTLHSPGGNLRGCIGNIEPFEPLAENVVSNALNAAFSDPRFPPVGAGEIDSLDIEISILSVPEPIAGHKEFIVGRHGIILNLRGSGAVFLPQVAPEQGWDAETTLTHLSLKAGLPHDAWKDERCRFRVFEAVHFSEKDMDKDIRE